MDTFFSIALTVAIAAVVQLISRQFSDRITRRMVHRHRNETKADEKKREDTVAEVFRRSFGVIIWFVALLVILTQLEINLSALLTGAGLLGVVVGLGAQSTIKDYIAGMYILAENQYRVGDIITLSGGTAGVKGASGVVEDISLRITKLRDLDGTLNIVRNGEASIITNRTFNYSAVVVDVNVTYDSSLDAVEKVMNKVGITMAGEERWKEWLIEPIQFLWVDALKESAVVVRAGGKVQAAAQWDVAGEYRRRLVPAFREAGIEIGLPQVIISEHKKTK